jgi:hypothetical protein
MKKYFALFYALVIGLNSFAFKPRNIDEKLLQFFKETFPRAENVIWKELEDSYVVNFIEDGIRINIIYDKDGSFYKSTRYYLEQNLPYYLLINIQKKYPNHKIFGVTEVSTISEIEYYVKLENAKIWVTLEVDSQGNISVVEKFRKAP